jgi:hypothetical protein
MLTVLMSLLMASLSVAVVEVVHVVALVHQDVAVVVIVSQQDVVAASLAAVALVVAPVLAKVKPRALMQP